jgi:hypothetical protein
MMMTMMICFSCSGDDVGFCDFTGFPGQPNTRPLLRK